MAKYVLTEFRMNSEAETFLSIKSRPAGLLNWILSHLGIVATDSFTASRECLDFKSTSLKGFSSVSAPLPCVTSVVSGMKKPFWMLVATIICLFLGTFGAVALGPGAIFFLILAVVFGILYYINKNFYIGFMNGGDTLYYVQFHSSVIEGVTVDNAKVQEACALVREAILDCRKY